MRIRRFIALWDNARLAVGTLAANPLRSLLIRFMALILPALSSPLSNSPGKRTSPRR